MSWFARLRSAVGDLLIRGYEYATVYDGPGEADVVYEGAVRVHLDGWVELGNGDLLSPASLHRIEDRTLPDAP